MKTIENGHIQLKKGNSVSEGVFISDSGEKAEITVWCKDAENCKICLYVNNKLLYKIPMFSMEDKGVPDLFTLSMEGAELADFLRKCEYQFEADRTVLQDSYMRAVAGRDRFGCKPERLRGRFYVDSFDWTGENRQHISYEDMILYQCHLRGFTRHSSSGVKNPGTFSGFVEKLGYLTELGVNTILFLPLYDFNERMAAGEERKINYWGYTGDACYFAPKASYAVRGADAVREMKQMVKEIHRKGMNLLLDMHFVDQSPEFIIRCLKYYATEYHIDGFLVNTDVVSGDWIIQDPVLRQCKFLGNRWENAVRVKGQKKFGCFCDDFMTVARRFLKSDEGQTGDFFQSFKADDPVAGRIHYITQKNGFTLRDLVSYDVKHNEANGERNMDGTEFNYSWNCGQEGVSRKKVVNAMRLQQTRNALCMLFLGLATPMLLAGDEFGRTQKGNNNAYCQDNAVTWMDWRLLEKNREIYEFTKKLIGFRRDNPLYCRNEAISGMDSRGLGAPGVSGHGIEPWEADFSYYSREVGILFYGSYFNGKSIYMIFNFHWDAHEFFLPVIDTTKKWDLLIDTGDAKEKPLRGIRKYVVSPRSTVVFESTEMFEERK